MATDNPVDALFRFFSPTIRLPGGGDIGSFRYAPHTSWEAPALFRGNDAIEQAVYRDVASPGTQLGVLIDAVLALAEHTPQLAGSEPIARLRELQEDIDSTKTNVRKSTTGNLRSELDHLKKNDSEALRSLLKDYLE